MNFISIIPKLVRGFEIEKGSIILLQFWGENSDLNILDAFSLEIAKSGGIPIKWHYSREFMKKYYSEVSIDNLAFPDKYFEIFKFADTVIDIFTYSPRPHGEFPSEKLPCYSAFMRKLFGTLSSSAKKFLQIRVPTMENAEEEEIDFETYSKASYNAMDIDYLKMKEKCSKLISKLKDVQRVEIHTGDNNIMNLSLENRLWFRDDGIGDIPCGEIYIAPVENSCQGTILIPEVFMEGEKFSDVMMEFRAGKLVDASESKLLEFIKSAPGDSDVIAEFGIGLNENVKTLIGCPSIDEKCIGTAHIAVGMNSMFGGKNDSPLHMDFVFIPSGIVFDGDEHLYSELFS